MLIDAHVHSFEKIMGLIGRGEVTPVGFGKVRCGTGEEWHMMPPSLVDTAFPGEILIEYMDWLGLDKVVLLQGNFYGFHNEYVSSLLRRWPNRFAGCAYVDPMLDSSVKVLRYAIENLRLGGLKLELSQSYGLTGLHPGMKLDAPSLEKFWECFAEYELPLVLDLGPIGGRGYQLDELVNMLSSYPKIHPVVICHLGGVCKRNETDPQVQEIWQKFLSIAKDQGFYIDIASLPFAFEEEYPCPTAQKYVEFACQVLGAERILWGSDVPGILCRVTYHQALDILRKHCPFLNSKEKNLILGENALRVYRFTS